MEKFHWNPTKQDLAEILFTIFEDDGFTMVRSREERLLLDGD